MNKSNHPIFIGIGNVLTTVSDRKFQVSDGANPPKVDYYTADICSSSDYYPFGSLMPGRNSTANYRFGFNSQERVDEISGNGNHNTALFWEYDTRTGRRWNLDPKSIVGISDYACFTNNPVFFSDLLGDEVDVTKTEKEDKKDLKADLEAKTGYTLLEKDGKWIIDKGKGIARDANGKKIGSKTARTKLQKAINSKETIFIISDNDNDEIDDGSVTGNEIRLDFSDIRKNISSNTSSGLNSTTFGFALVTFHEFQHTKPFGSLRDPIERKKNYFERSSADYSPNQIRKELGSSYGQRQHYSFLVVSKTDYVEGLGYRSYVAMDKQSLKDLKAGKIPTGQYIIHYQKKKEIKK